MKKTFTLLLLLFITNLISAQTLIKDINIGVSHSTEDFVPLPSNQVLFTANDSTRNGIWISDGKTNQTIKLIGSAITTSRIVVSGDFYFR